MYQNHNSDAFERRTLKEVTSSTEVKPELKQGGYDGGIEVGFEGRWDKKQFADLLVQLEAAKVQAAEDSKSAYATIGGEPVLVDPSGANVGLHYKYTFTFDGVKFFIHHNPPKDRQGVRIRYSAASLIGRNLFALHKAVLTFLRSLGFIVTEEKISRVDMQVMLDCKTSALVQPILGGNGVAKCQTFDIHGKGKRIETYTLGQAGRLQLCIYDKRKELDKSMVNDPVKTELLMRYCLGEEWFFGSRPITRIEFRLWRDVLREVGIIVTCMECGNVLKNNLRV